MGLSSSSQLFIFTRDGRLRLAFSFSSSFVWDFALLFFFIRYDDDE